MMATGDIDQLQIGIGGQSGHGQDGLPEASPVAHPYLDQVPESESHEDRHDRDHGPAASGAALQDSPFQHEDHDDQRIAQDQPHRRDGTRGHRQLVHLLVLAAHQHRSCGRPDGEQRTFRAEDGTEGQRGQRRQNGGRDVTGIDREGHLIQW